MAKPKEENRIFIGTSGWIYRDWKKVFYPENLFHSKELSFYAKRFNTVEVNYSFYRLPEERTFKSWAAQVPENFVFSVKASRFITHIKRLKGVEGSARTFLNNASALGRKLGPVLFQLPSNFKAKQENIERFEKFLEILGKIQKGNSALKFVFELRHESWFNKKTYEMLRGYKIALCIADSPDYPKTDVITADFIYVRMHGGKVIFGSKYSNEELEGLAQKIKKWQKDKLPVFVYFNNDFRGYAAENAAFLKRELGIDIN